MDSVAYSILVVDEQPTEVARLVQPLENAGYRVTGATTFEAAMQTLTERPPHLLIAAERLGSFNGLHLVLRGRFDHPQMAAIVTAGAKDPVLEAEATTFGASCVVAPRNSTELLALVTRTFAMRPM
jgi:PleD family two-component response regulator